MPYSVAIALGSNLGDREYFLRSAVRQLREAMTVVRVSAMRETDPVDAPRGSGRFLNAVAVGFTEHSPEALLAKLHDIESRLGRRRGIRNAPRTIDLDLILHSANVRKTRTITIPHPRYRERTFVMGPLAELHLAWRDPASGLRVSVVS